MAKKLWILSLSLVCLALLVHPLQAQTIHVYEGWNFVAFNYEFISNQTAQFDNFSKLLRVNQQPLDM